MKLRFRILALIVICLSIPAFFYGVLAAKESPAQMIKKEIAEANGIPIENLEVAYEEYMPLRLTNKGYTYVKVIEKKTGKGYEGAADRSGNIVGHQALKDAEAAAHKAKYGKLHPSLYNHLQDKGPDDLVKINFWLDMGGKSAAIERPIPDEARALGKEKLRQLTQEGIERAKVIHHEVESPLLRVIEKKGFVARGSALAPMVFAELPKKVIEELARFPQVSSIDLEREVVSDVLEDPSSRAEGDAQKTAPRAATARRTEKADVVQSRLIDGYPYWLAVMEVYEDGTSNSAVSNTNPFLNNGHHDIVYYDNSAPLNVSIHATAVAGFAASTHGATRGTAPHIRRILSGNYDSSWGLMDEVQDWALDNFADVSNHSWGEDSPDGDMDSWDRWADYVVREYRHPLVKSAGNAGRTTGYISSPGMGYNVLTVGSIDDFDNADWDDDQWSGFSSWREDEPGRQKPEVMAVGATDSGRRWGLTGTNTQSPWIGGVGSGTSYAAPAVSGMMATLMDRDSGLEPWPEALKAIAIASALNHIADRELAGAGAIDMAAADHIAAEGWWHGQTVTGASFGSDRDIPVKTINLLEGETFRAALAYDSTSVALFWDFLEGDLDLHLREVSSGNLVAASAGTDSWELIEYQVPSNGVYQLLVHNYAYDEYTNSETTHIGVAWWPGALPHLEHDLVTRHDAPINVGDHHRLDTAATSDWSAVAMRPPANQSFDLLLDDNSLYGNPADFRTLAISSQGSGSVEVVLVDRNHAPAKSYYPVVMPVGTVGEYDIQKAIAGGVIDVGEVNVSTGDGGVYPGVAWIWDVPFAAGVAKFVRAVPTSGDADLGLLLFDSNGIVPGSFYQSADQAVQGADLSGAGGAEQLAYTSGENDTLGLVVYNKRGQTTDTNWTLYVDDTALAGTISINGGDPYTPSKYVDLTLSCTSGGSGCSEMRFSNNGTDWSTWVPYSTSQTNWPLCTDVICTGGTYTVYVQYKNAAGMVSPSFSDTIVWDTFAPSGSILINNGDAETASSAVTLALSCTDGDSGCNKMRFSDNNIDWFPWQDYSASGTWHLPSGEGTNTVYVQYQDGAGNISGSFSDDITLKTQGAAGASNADETLTPDAGGRLEIFIRYDGSADSLWENFQLAPNNGWGGWATFGGPAASDPVVAQNLDGLLEVFSIGTDGALWHKKQGVSAWSSWASLGKPGADLIGRLAVARNSDGTLEVFARRDDTSLHHIRQTAAGDWTGASWAQLGGPATSDPAVAQNLNGCLEVFVRGTDGALWHKSQTSASSCASWGSWASLSQPSSGPLTSNIAVARNADGRLQVFVRGTDGIIHHIGQTAAGNWTSSAWRQLASATAPQATSDPAVAENADGRLEVFVRGTDNALWHSWQLTPGGFWSSWQSLGGALTSNLLAARNQDGRLEVFARGPGPDNEYLQIWQTSPGSTWSAWASLGVPELPDLVVESITTDPASPASGENAEVTVRVKNDSSTISPGFAIDFYKDLSVSPTTGQSGDFTCSPPFLFAYGFTFDCVGTVSYAGDGTYEMWAQVDTGETVEESDEEDNILGPQDIVVSPPSAFALIVAKAGTGSGNVTSTPPGIDCGLDCSESYASGTPVTLTATPDAGSTFVGWGGAPDCSDGTVTMDSAKSCTATFDDTTAPSTPQNLTITPTGVESTTLSWDASTDTGGSGVAGYRVYDTLTGALMADTPLTSEEVSGLVGAVSYYVKAYDVAGNLSDRSRFATTRIPVRFSWQTVPIAGKTFAANPAGSTATASFIFEGDSVSINYGCGLNTGIFEVSIDGAVVDTVDAYCSPPDFSAKKTYAVSPGGHTITIRPTGEKNTSSTYFWTLLDSFEVAGETYQEDDGISYTWQTVDILGATFSANPAGGTAYVSFTYVGDSASINYGCGVNTGIFEVWMDAAVVEPVDAYCSPPDFSAKKTYPTASGTHTIEVRPTGTNNPSSSYFWTLIDSFEVGGSTYQAQALPPQEAEELEIPKGRLSKLLQRLPKPIRERIERRLERYGGIASADTISLLNSEKLTRLLKRLEGKEDEE